MQKAVSKLCETWWLNYIPGKERLVNQFFTYAVIQFLQEDASMTDSKRVSAVREALELFDFERPLLAALIPRKDAVI